MSDVLAAIEALMQVHDRAWADPALGFPFPCGCEYEDPCLAGYPQVRALVKRCREAEAKLDDKSACHTERVKELQAFGAKHAQEVEAAFKEAYGEGPGPSPDAAWLASEARKRVRT